MSTILLPILPSAVEHLYLHLAAPPPNVAAQFELTLPVVVVGGLVLLLVILALLFWRVSRKPRSAPPEQAETLGESPEQIVIPLPPQPAAISLEFMAEAGQHVRFTLEKPALTIGRASDNDIVVAAPILNVDTVSQHHARLRRDQDAYIVRDLNSRNGLMVNGRHTIENLLQDGDRIRFGEVEATFHQSAGGAA